ncbi:MAG: hypothetical protein CM15mV18_1390 [uncultured marine virus]|nr:MAG: hypothetical protein CM15mV18_1390 [uncultured marine virus]
MEEVLILHYGDLNNVTISSMVLTILIYNGSAWVNEYDYESKGKYLLKLTGSLTTISMTNNKDMTTINGFLDSCYTIFYIFYKCKWHSSNNNDEVICLLSEYNR